MKRALLFTAYNRPGYLESVLESWSNVRGIENWYVLVLIEPSSCQDQIVKLFDKVGFPDVDIRVNPQVYGVLHNPWVGFEELFNSGYDFVLRAEDDLLVSDDVLEYYEWASEKFQDDDHVATVCGFTHDDGPDSDITMGTGFGPWIWGTWARTWTILGPTWDHDYSTNNGTPGVEAGWDYNIDKRLFPKYHWRNVYPKSSRVQNIGVQGTHASPADFIQTTSYKPHREPTEYRMV